MRFCTWYRASEIGARADDGPGVFQVRGGPLLQYPSGRSAMIHYGHAPRLREAMLAWAAAHPVEGARYRHASELGSRTPQQAHALLERRFIDRFGAAPSPAPATTPP